MDRKDKSRRGSSSSASASSMAALAAAAAAGEGSSSGSAGEALTPNGEEEQKPAKLAAVGGASSSSPVPARRGAAAGGGGGPRCQAERCNADLSDAATYNRRHKVCQTHSKAPVVLVAGLRQRFCQQCSRFHELSEFDETRRSCRLRLAGHNERRRKSSADTHGGGSGGSNSGGGDGCRHADQDGRGHQGNPPPNHFQIR
ncbi:hypothetical protein SEVIR_2G336100v4 [Setaria viridis]|uniref:SBP-type domain-containing protein n=2 Tax=Setaria TaxID=4554 RepID=K3ZX22_SETIT|nr:squamosa promoter-binding-like protein 13 [Setaria italica]XP_034583348.1 squamosa promoter-binding-like protein 13 [Setaria viridis]RCV13157.1 hypothetical protein SETIT_2G324900v2 [Setaria italica]TKW34889.1 hypothetical protein SEVIR_2G336100v2 [Setaria viridis]